MSLPKASKVLLISAAAVFGQVARAQVTAHAVMPGPLPAGTYRSHAWVASTSSPSAVVHAPGQSSANCAPSTNDCYYFPADLVTAYAIGSIAHGNGGSGITVGIVDAFYNSQTAADLATYSSTNGLPACTTASGCLTIVNSSGVNCTTSPASCTTDSTFNGEGWALETDLDLDAVHSMAPNAHILLVTAANTGNDLFASVQYASLHANVVSSSWGGGEFSGEDTFGATYFSGSPVPLLWSAGDTGAAQEYPCMSIYALCVGGSRLITTATSFRNVESAWGGADTGGGGGGGCSADVTAPAFQSGFSTADCGTARGAPDVSALADEYTGFITGLGSFAALGLSSSCTTTLCPAGEYVIGGTSLASPLTAGVIANIDADRVFNGKSILGSNLNALIYQAAGSSYRYRFYDITTGSTGFAAGTGWDEATGLGVILGPSLATYLLTTP
jgi:subtilase family serine protease